MCSRMERLGGVGDCKRCSEWKGKGGESGQAMQARLAEE
jgi:hypothetical protein